MGLSAGTSIAGDGCEMTFFGLVVPLDVVLGSFLDLGFVFWLSDFLFFETCYYTS